MFVPKQLADIRRRSFQITIGLMEGYDTKVHHTPSQVLALIGEWMRSRMQAGLPVLTGGMLVNGRDPGLMIYAWNSKATGIQVNQEDTVLFVGEVNPLYNAGLSDEAAMNLVQDLASFIGERLNQTRMYGTFMDRIFVLENDKAVHPTEAQ